MSSSQYAASWHDTIIVAYFAPNACTRSVTPVQPTVESDSAVSCPLNQTQRCPVPWVRLSCVLPAHHGVLHTADLIHIRISSWNLNHICKQYCNMLLLGTQTDENKMGGNNWKLFLWVRQFVACYFCISTIN